MTPPAAAPVGPARRPPAGALIVLAAFTLAALSVAEYRAWSAARRLSLAALSDGTALRSPEIARDIALEPDRVRASLRAARGLLADELDRGWQLELDPTARETAERAGLQRLARAGEIAAEGLARRPASWQAAEVLGATRYLDTLRRRLPMTAERRDAWSRPLLAARNLGPAQAEPVRFHAAATLSEWPRLTGLERDAALDLFRDAFRDPETFDLLAASWLRIAPSRSAAFAPVPPEPRAWRAVGRFYAERGDWGAFSLAHDRGAAALLERLEEQLANAERRLRGRDWRRARWYALEILEKAPPSRSYRHLVARALEILPPGPLGEIRAQRMTEWLDWSRDQCLLGACPFPPETLARMAGLAQLAGEAARAAAAEMAGDPVAAELLARGAEDLSAPWAPYHLLRARRLAGLGEPDAAAHSLARVDPTWHSRAAYFETRDLTRATGDESTPSPRPSRSTWPASAWIGGDRLLLELYPAADCREVEIEMLGVSPNGSAVEVHWDADLAGAHPVSPGRPLRLPLAISAGAIERLEIDPFIHPLLRPGRVWLRDCVA